MISTYTSWVAPSGALTFVNQRRADKLGLPRGLSGWLRSKSDRRECLPRDGFVMDPAVNARADDSHAEDQESFSFAGFVRSAGCCLGFRHWQDLASLGSAYPRENSVAFNWTGSCVTCDRGVAEDSAQAGPGSRLHGQRSTRR
jgi:hypothetical protein